MRHSSIIIVAAACGLLAVMVLAAGCTQMGEEACAALSGRDRDHCYQKIAKTTGDRELCDRIEGAGPASKCYAYVAGVNGEIATCAQMETMPWRRDTEAYRWADCILYVARTANCPDFCEALQQYEGGATDLSPGVTVSEKWCRASVACGKTGQPACRSRNGPSLVASGSTKAYYCTVNDVTMFYPSARTC